MTPLEALKKHFGYESFRGAQATVIERVLAGEDALVLMPTGGGKSLCYQIPAIVSDGVTIVVSPLISLMKDQVDGLREAGVEAAAINSTMTPSEITGAMYAAESGRTKIVYLAPERLTSPATLAWLDRLKLTLIAVDEAHCISEWGHDFRPDYRTLRTLRERYPQVPMLGLTATATDQVRRDIVGQLGLRRGRVYVTSFDRPNLTYAVVPKTRGAAEQVQALVAAHPDESAIVYCGSRATTERLAQDLSEAGVRAMAYHAGLEKSERERVQEMFIRDDVQVVIATIAFGMGIDKPDVRLVIHHDLPKSVEGYYQETGRAGRDGLPSQCVLLYSAGDRAKQMYFIKQIGDANERAKAWQKLDQVLDYANATLCRRRYLLKYFGEVREGLRCDNCDVCRPELKPELESGQLAAGSGQRARGREVGRRQSAPRSAVSAEAMPLFARLRALRKRLADERGVPAYVVFGDRTLQDMIEKRPTTSTEMSHIFGVGAQKLVTYGQAFLDELNGDGPEAPAPKPRVQAGSSVRETARLFTAGHTMEEVVEMRHLSINTVIQHLEEIAEAGGKVSASLLWSDDGRLQDIRAAFDEVGYARLSPVLQKLGEDYNFTELRLARVVIKMMKGEKVMGSGQNTPIVIPGL